MLNKPLHISESASYAAPVKHALPQMENPFPGLRSFSTDDSHLFFGRDGQIDEILDKLARNRFVAVMGYSGSGKSSLMFCGLVPALYGGFIAHSGSNWNVVTTRPGASPIRSLISSVIEFMVKTGRIEESESEVYRAIINAVLRSSNEGLIEVARFLQRNDNENTFFLI